MTVAPTPQPWPGVRAVLTRHGLDPREVRQDGITESGYWHADGTWRDWPPRVGQEALAAMDADRSIGRGRVEPWQRSAFPPHGIAADARRERAREAVHELVRGARPTMRDDEAREAMRALLDRPGDRILRELRDRADRRILDDLGPTRDPATDPGRCTFTTEVGRCYLDSPHNVGHLVAEVRRA